MLTNQEDGDFTITELEVWSIEEVVRNNMILIYIERMNTVRETERKKHRQREKLKRETKHREKEGTETLTEPVHIIVLIIYTYTLF
jgi:hypothetical protein